MKNLIESKYSPGKKVSFQQYIAEIICENSARKSKTSLPLKFWKLKEWAGFYRANLGNIQKLCNTYGHVCVLKFVQDKKIYALLKIYDWMHDELQTCKDNERTTTLVESKESEAEHVGGFKFKKSLNYLD